MLARVVLGISLLLIVLPALAYADPLDDATRRVGLQLQCPVCEGQSVAESNSGLARDMRALIRTRLEAGASEQAILDEFIASYGDSILSEPPKRGISLGVWIGPLLGLVLGIGLLVIVLRSWRRTPRLAAAGPTGVAGLDPDVADEFNRFRNEYGR